MKIYVRAFLFLHAVAQLCAAQPEFHSYWKIGEDYFFSLRNGGEMSVISSSDKSAQNPCLEFVSFDEDKKILTVKHDGKNETLSIKAPDGPCKFAYEPSNPEIAKLIKHGKISSQIIVNGQTGVIFYDIKTDKMEGKVIINTRKNGIVLSEIFIGTDENGNVTTIPADHTQSIVKEEKHHPFSEDLPIESRNTIMEMPATINIAPEENIIAPPDQPKATTWKISPE